MLRHAALWSLLLLGIAGPAGAQVPSPFPRPGQPATPNNPPPVAAPRPPVAAPQAPVGQPAGAQAAAAPTEASLGVPIYPNAQYLGSYDAGQGQKFHLFGSASDFSLIVGFYKSVLRQKGEPIFDEPPMQMFDLGRFREESMGFPPSVTVKDYTWGGSQGYLNPTRGASPERFPTVIQIVVAPPGAAR